MKIIMMENPKPKEKKDKLTSLQSLSIGLVLLLVGILTLRGGIPELKYYIHVHNLPQLSATIIAESEPETYKKAYKDRDRNKPKNYSLVCEHTITVVDETGKTGTLTEYTEDFLQGSYFRKDSVEIDDSPLYKNGSRVEELRHVGDTVEGVVRMDDDTLVFSGDISSSLVEGILMTVMGIVMCAAGLLYLTNIITKKI